jgi:uncharacterized membrane protein
MREMKFLSETNYHRLFRWGVSIKLAVSFFEIMLGVALTFLSYEAIKQFIFFFAGNEIAESPRDFFWDYAARGYHTATAAPESFWAFLFISHGVVKLFLAWGLWKEKLWSFPLSAVVFSGFVVYQLYQLTYLNSFFLWLITVFDIALIVLILREYRRRKMNLGSSGQER